MKKLGKISIFLLIVLLFSTSYVFASSFNFGANASATSLKPGDTISITLSVSDIDAGELGINVVEAFLEYDKNVFEEVAPNDFAGLNNWSITYNNESGENSGKFVAVIVQDGVTENQDIGTVTLKVKQGIADQNTAITIKEIKSNDGTAEMSTADKTINVEIKTPQPEIPVEPENPSGEENQNNNNQNNNNQSNNNQNNNNQNNNQNDENQSPNPIPQTGDTTIFIVIAVAIIALLAGIIYYAYTKNKDII